MHMRWCVTVTLVHRVYLDLAPLSCDQGKSMAGRLAITSRIMPVLPVKEWMAN